MANGTDTKPKTGTAPKKKDAPKKDLEQLMADKKREGQKLQALLHQWGGLTKEELVKRSKSDKELKEALKGVKATEGEKAPPAFKK